MSPFMTLHEPSTVWPTNLTCLCLNGIQYTGNKRGQVSILKFPNRGSDYWEIVSTLQGVMEIGCIYVCGTLHGFKMFGHFLVL